VTTLQEVGFNWSFSKLMMWESCAMRLKLRYIEKLPEPPLPKENPMERGNRIHTRLEHYVQGKGPIDTEAKAIDAFVPALNHLQVLYAEQMAITEDNWFYNDGWDVCERDQVWLWAKLDFLVKDIDEGHAIIGDHKSGKSGYKTMEHVQQLQLYGAITALRYEWADRITAELWYVDEGWVRKSEFDRDEALAYVGRFDRRVERMYADRLFKPNASAQICRYCPYSPRGTGACPVGV
jgi:CRISPR/Cas system-associated exonuclease Cas4 (RecB family)